MSTECKVAVLMTSHNRKGKTIACLEKLLGQDFPSETSKVEVFLLDDNSEDGTELEVRRRFPQVNVLKGDGHLYWCGGMRRVFSRAMEEDADYYLWLNDDTNLEPWAVRFLLGTYKRVAGEESSLHIIVGSTADPETSELTYGGLARDSRWHPFRYKPVPPSDTPEPCHTFNGNCVLIPREVVRRIGNIDPSFTHSFGDIDYGLRAGNAGIRLWVAPGIVGACPRNLPRSRWDSSHLSLRERVAKLTDPKGLPIRETRVFAQRHGGRWWPLFWVMPIVRGVLFPSGGSRLQ